MKKRKIEEKVTEVLTEGEYQTENAEDAAVDHIHSKYEIRQQTELDPIAQETRIIRKVVKNDDQLYNDYMSRIENEEN
ncbi:hypothetical protein [Chengkuizengella axinellae]|uniref:DUF4025 domain-containing protein n=1 Tax=Chengkuizengella axinellae TaxID=3064388 RepID=A0ABT9J137_9BACL|nr:hypothetical protein [Chengkuizengella sp. 2205SS18-9]MDP5275336.1 hypothetical protein [Chengkuizengella sp. 2205SS18-9]